MVGGVQTQKIKFHTWCVATHKLEIKYATEVLHCYKSFEIHVKLPNLGIWQRN